MIYGLIGTTNLSLIKHKKTKGETAPEEKQVADYKQCDRKELYQKTEENCL